MQDSPVASASGCRIVPLQVLGCKACQPSRRTDGVYVVLHVVRATGYNPGEGLERVGEGGGWDGVAA